MSVTFELPPGMERDLRQRLGNLDEEAKEALLLDLYRKRELTHAQLASALDLSRVETDALLKQRGIYYELTSDDVDREAEELHRLRTSHDHRR